MKTVFKSIFAILLLLAAVALTALYISTHEISMFSPKGEIALKQREILVTASELMLIVLVPVFVLTLFFSWRYRENNAGAKHAPDWEHNNIAEMCWWGVPLLIIIILAVITWKTSHSLNPFRPLENKGKHMPIQAVALEWKWLFLFPEEGIAAINYVQFPEKVPLAFEITADAPMNSFWIPALGGQIYAMPSMRSKIHLIADKQGSFRGSSANISGKGFAGMVFTAKASSQQAFDEWVASVKQSAKPLTWEEYNRLVEPSEYTPPTTYVLQDKELFDQILMKYEPPRRERK